MKRLIILGVLSVLMGLGAFAMEMQAQPAQRGRIRDFGIEPGIFKPGKFNAITDVEGVRVGHVTIIEGKDVRTMATYSARNVLQPSM